MSWLCSVKKGGSTPLKAKTSLLDFQFFDFASLLALVFQSSLKGESVRVWGHCHSQVPFRRKNNNIGR